MTDFIGAIGVGIACFTSILIRFCINLFLDGPLYRLIKCYTKTINYQYWVFGVKIFISLFVRVDFDKISHDFL